MARAGEHERGRGWIGTGLGASASRRGVWVGLVFLLVLFGVPFVGAAQAAGTATDAMRSTINDVIRIVEDQDLKKPTRSIERRKMLEKVVGDRFSYEEMAKRSLGAQWPKLTDKERQEFVDLFTSLLTATYAQKVEGYTGEQVHYLSERLDGGYAEVKTKVASAKLEVPLDYRLLTKNGDWRVYDVVVDNVSLVSNYRGQFTKILRTSSFQDLIEAIRKKVEKPDKPLVP